MSGFWVARGKGFHGTEFISKKSWTHCAECGQQGEPGRYHPFAFCVLIKAGIDPIAFVKEATAELGIGPRRAGK